MFDQLPDANVFRLTVAIDKPVPDALLAVVASSCVPLGIRAFEVNIGLPAAADMFAVLAGAADPSCSFGARGVLSRQQVYRAAIARARYIASPDTDAAVIETALECGLDAIPGFFTPTEALKAVANGAETLRLMPPSLAQIPVLHALKDCLPEHACLEVDGLDAGAGLAPWMAAGVAGGTVALTPDHTASGFRLMLERMLQSITMPGPGPSGFCEAQGAGAGN
ncbi:MAG: hypothetical protein EP335_08035 [Alphaproteobacteria bacterium]|nr:MAG: hypothetical protein EP335_08035 [Alphaproteobacteria bacterium]